MLVSQHIETSLPILALDDKVSFALDLMDEYDLLHLPISSDEKYLGLVAKDDLLDSDESAKLSSIEKLFIRAFVFLDDVTFSAIKIANRFEVSIVPVIDRSGKLAGMITSKELLKTTGEILNVEQPGGIIILEMDKRNFSFGEISRLVETNNSYITQLNTYTESGSGFFVVVIKTNSPGISDIVATLQRYDYQVRHYFGEEEYTNELKENYDLLMTYLNI